MRLPKQVINFKRTLPKDHALFELASVLISDDPDLVTMWRLLEKRGGSDSLWIVGFLEAASVARTLPSYHYVSGADRRELAERIGDLANSLARVLESNKLDLNLVRIDSAMLSGFYILEDFEDSKQQRLGELGTLHSTQLLTAIAERSSRKIKEASAGKASRNVRAIRFARQIAERNKHAYGQPLNEVVAAATNALFGTSYSDRGIEQLRFRAPRQLGKKKPSD